MSSPKRNFLLCSTIYSGFAISLGSAIIVFYHNLYLFSINALQYCHIKFLPHLMGYQFLASPQNIPAKAAYSCAKGWDGGKILLKVTNLPLIHIHHFTPTLPSPLKGEGITSIESRQYALLARLCLCCWC